MGGRGSTARARGIGGGVPTPPISQSQQQDITGNDITRNDVRRLQQAMGQTGDEAGQVNPRGGGIAKLYVNTSKAFNINAYLNSDGKSISSPLSNWDNLGYTKRMVANDIARIDAGMKPLPENINLRRFVDADNLSSMIGINVSGKNFNDLIYYLKNDQTFKNSFSTKMAQLDYTQKSYSSMVYEKSHPAFGDRDVRIEFVARKGTQAIVTNNHAESEVLGARNLKYNFTGRVEVDQVTDSRGRKRDQLVLYAYL